MPHGHLKVMGKSHSIYSLISGKMAESFVAAYILMSLSAKMEKKPWLIFKKKSWFPCKSIFKASVESMLLMQYILDKS